MVHAGCSTVSTCTQETVLYRVLLLLLSSFSVLCTWLNSHMLVVFFFYQLSKCGNGVLKFKMKEAEMTNAVRVTLLPPLTPLWLHFGYNIFHVWKYPQIFQLDAVILKLALSWLIHGWYRHPPTLTFPHIPVHWWCGRDASQRMVSLLCHKLSVTFGHDTYSSSAIICTEGKECMRRQEAQAERQLNQFSNLCMFGTR